MKASPPISLCLSSVSEKLYRKKGHTELILVIVLLFLLHAIIFMTLVLMQLLFRCTGTVPFFLLLFLRLHLVLLANRQAGKQNIHCDEVRHAPVDAVLHRDKAFVGSQQRNIR